MVSSDPAPNRYEYDSTRSLIYTIWWEEVRHLQFSIHLDLKTKWLLY